MDNRLNISHQPCSILGCIRKSTSSTSREMILPYWVNPGETCLSGPSLGCPVRERCRCTGASPAKMIKWLEHFSYEERLIDLRLFKLKQRRLVEHLISVYKYMMESVEEIGPDFSQWFLKKEEKQWA